MKKNLCRVVAAVLLVASLIGVCTACGPVDQGEDNNQEQPKADLVVFENGKYQIEFVSPAEADAEVSAIRNDLRAAFKAKTGITPNFKGDDKSDADSAVLEILLGNTNRPESAKPEGVVAGTDSYYVVAVIGNKLVINGSDPYQLEIAADYFVENYLSGDVAETLIVPATVSEQKILKGYAREGWLLNSIPAYPAGVNTLTTSVYSSGTTITDLSSNRNKSDVSIQRVDKTTLEEFEAYLAKMESFGFEKEYENLTSENLFLTYKAKDQRVHISYRPAASEVQVIHDPKGIGVEEFGYTYTPKAGERSEFYLYGIPMADGKGNDHPNCGTLSVIKCADNSVIIIDGGEYEGEGDKKQPLQQMYGEEVMNAFDAFLHQITSTPAGEKVRVSAWYLTHYHSDHTKGLLEFFKLYKANYELERVIANIPIADCGGTAYKFGATMLNWAYKQLDDWSVLIKTNFPNCKELKVHAGQKIQIADVALNVIYTHEDLISSKARFNSGDSNDTSTVIRADNGQMSMMILGDIGQTAQARIKKYYSEATLKSDIVEPAHHLINNVFEIYNQIQPTFALVPQSYECSQSQTNVSGEGTYISRYNKLLTFVDRENCYFAGNETVGLAVIDGKVQVCYYVEGVVGRREGSK